MPVEVTPERIDADDTPKMQAALEDLPRMGNVWTNWAEIALPRRKLTSLVTRFTLEAGWRPTPRTTELQLLEARAPDLVAQPEDEADWECNEKNICSRRLCTSPATYHKPHWRMSVGSSALESNSVAC